MNDDEKEALAQALAGLAQETCAIRDVLALMCLHLSEHPEAAGLAEQLRAIGTNQRLQPTAAFAAVATEMADALEQKMSLTLRSLGSPPPRLTREELRRALRVVVTDDPAPSR